MMAPSLGPRLPSGMRSAIRGGDKLSWIRSSCFLSPLTSAAIRGTPPGLPWRARSAGFADYLDDDIPLLLLGLGVAVGLDDLRH